MSLHNDEDLTNPSDNGRSFSDALEKALRSVGSNGQLNKEGAIELYQTMRKMPRELRSSIVLEPEKYFGPFDSLPVDARHAIVQAVASDDKWRMAGHEIGDCHVMITRLLWRLNHKLSEYNLGRLTKLAEIFAIVIQSGPAYLVYALYQRQNQWRGKLSARPTLHSVLNTAGMKPRDFAICYVRNIPQPEAYRGFWHDLSLHNTYGVALGIDLIPTPEGCWYIESNLNFGMSSTRTALYDRDPFVTNLVDFTAEQGYCHLMIVYNKSSHMDKVMAEQYKEEAQARNIQLSIVEDAFLPKSGYTQSFCVPSVVSEHTLVVRTKGYHTSLDYLFDNKNAAQRALEMYKKNSSDPSLMLPTSGPEPVPGNIDENDPFPNLVYKFPESDAGKGVIFLKATSPDHAHMILKEAVRLNRQPRFIDRLNFLIKDQNGIFQSYVRAPLLTGRVLYKVRAHVLLTPLGTRFLSAHRVVSRFMVPEHLPSGIVYDPKPYLVNLSSSSAYEIVPPKEESSVIMASLAVAKGLSWAATYGFQTSLLLEDEF